MADDEADDGRIAFIEIYIASLAFISAPQQRSRAGQEGPSIGLMMAHQLLASTPRGEFTRRNGHRALRKCFLRVMFPARPSNIYARGAG